ncbi:hypothetical protein Nepgr_005801 [Nepenthes gracilis]|uniref:UPF3 domain-containing protein n=1 Tax=Nepenthes gracilis TaxID=150966 RepID=A0AAD3S4B4_NEPGR|nr:hypothetical protein Nepgr_005801 [Nepenthes gracilis]
MCAVALRVCDRQSYIAQFSSFFDQIDLRFAGRYNWSSFRPSKNSHKRQTYARAYINFNSPEDVFQFAEFFNGHVFVNEKGAQFKVIVEYSPSQRVPDASTKKDGREGTIFKDPEYVEFLEHVSKPMENLPSADVQLERREAERAGIPESPVVTPLMEYVRKKRAGKSAARDVAADVKFSGRVRTALRSKSRSSAAKQISEKKKYILKASGKSNVKDESTYILLPRRDDQLDSPSGKGLVENESESVSADTGKKKILLLKGKEPEISQNKVAASPVEKSPVTSALKMNPRHDAGGRINRSISLNKETFQSQSSPVQLEQKLQTISSEKSKRPPRAAGMRLGVSGYASINECSPVASESVGKRSVDDKSGGNGQPDHMLVGSRYPNSRIYFRILMKLMVDTQKLTCIKPTVLGKLLLLQVPIIGISHVRGNLRKEGVQLAIVSMRSKSGFRSLLQVLSMFKSVLLKQILADEG